MTAQDTPFKETVVLPRSGRKIVVREVDYYAGAKRGALAQEFVQKPHKDAIVQIGLVSLYAPLAACSDGDVPTAEEFPSILEVDLDAWLDVARKINPKWFAWMGEVEKELSAAEQKALKKKDRKRHEKSPRG